MGENRRFKPRFNHVAVTLSPEELNETGRKEILDFYGEVFGFTEHPTLTEDRQRLVLGCHRLDQFLFLIAGEKTTRCGPLDHVGMAVSTRAELDAVVAAARRYRERDDRVEVTDPNVDDYDAIKVHSTYVRFRLPLMFEVQYWEIDRENLPAAPPA